MAREQFSGIGTQSWRVLESLEGLELVITQVERDLQEPPFARKVRDIVWGNALLEKKSLLERQNPGTKYTIKSDQSNGGKDSLFRLPDDKRVMYDGITRTVSQAGPKVDGNKFIIPTYPIDYSEWVACLNPQYAKAFEDEGIALPYAGFGVSILIISSEGLAVLTRRGMETPIYPGMLYTPGGGSDLVKEMKEETGLEAGKDFDPNSIGQLAYVTDLNHMGSKHSRPETVARLQVNLPYSRIVELQNEINKRRGRKESDVWGYEPINVTNSTDLLQYIKLHGREMCPPTEALLAGPELYRIILKESSSPEEAFSLWKSYVKLIGQYSREPFIPPVKRLAD